MWNNKIACIVDDRQILENNVAASSEAEDANAPEYQTLKANEWLNCATFIQDSGDFPLKLQLDTLTWMILKTNVEWITKL